MSTHILDHLIHLTPPGSVDVVSAEFRRLGFEVIPGGTHAGGLTYNALVVLPDGVYLELIAFVNPDPPSSHRWGRASTGWIDYAMLGLDPNLADVINERAGSKLYKEGVAGGRKTPGGEILKWRLTVPDPKNGVGRLPFFCEDITPRELRVPNPGNHPSTAQGIAYVKVRATSQDEFKDLSTNLSSVLGIPPSASDSGDVATWALATPGSSLESSHPGTRLILEREAGSEEENKSGIHEVGFWVAQGKGGVADSPYGKVVWVPLPS